MACKHKNIVVKSFANYTIPRGYKWLAEQEDIDMADFYIQNDNDEIVCSDCGEFLER